jgi:hypothetical protein
VTGKILILNTPLQTIPDNFKAQESLLIQKAPLSVLPDNLHVRDRLLLDQTQVADIPNGLRVGGDLTIRQSPLGQKYTEEQIAKIIKDRGGFVKLGVRIE